MDTDSRIHSVIRPQAGTVRAACRDSAEPGNRTAKERGDSMYRSDWISPLGRIHLTSDGEAITGLWFEDRKQCGKGNIPGDGTVSFRDRGPDPDFREAESADESFALQKRCPVFVQTEQWLTAYFSGHSPDFCPPVRTSGTPFCELIWRLLPEIPYGETRTYGEIAGEASKRSGRRVSARAVGNAVGRNPVLLLIPCHRVIGADGQLTGYAGGLERKRELLQLEQKNVGL